MSPVSSFRSVGPTFGSSDRGPVATIMSLNCSAPFSYIQRVSAAAISISVFPAEAASKDDKIAESAIRANLRSKLISSVVFI